MVANGSATPGVQFWVPQRKTVQSERKRQKESTNGRSQLCGGLLIHPMAWVVVTVCPWCGCEHTGWDGTPLCGGRRRQRLVPSRTNPGGTNTYSGEISKALRPLLPLCRDLTEWNNQAEFEHVAFEVTTGSERWEISTHTEGERLREREGHAHTLSRFVTTIVAAVCVFSVSPPLPLSMDWPSSLSGWFDGAAQSHDAAQVAASGAAGVRSGHVLPGEPDPEAGGVPGKAR